MKEILNELVKELTGKMDLYSIIQFGSSTTSQNADDLDLLIISSEKVFPTKYRMVILEIIMALEEKYPGVAFDFSGSNREKRGDISITLIPLGTEGLDVKKNPN